MSDIKQSMAKEWEERAQENAYHWVSSDQIEWEKDAYYQKGQKCVATYVLPFLQEKGVAKEEITTFHVLDIGCGTGRLSRALSEHVAQVTGLDISETMLQKARADNADRKNITFLHTNGHDLHQIETGSIDFIFSFIVLQHIPSQSIIRSYFAEMQRVLRPGAYAKVQVRGTPGNPPGKVIWFHGFASFYLALCLWRKWLPLLWIRRYNTVYGACFTAKQLQRIVQQTGFTAVNVEYEEGNPQHLWAEVQATAS